jgi:hypothetical protein
LNFTPLSFSGYALNEVFDVIDAGREVDGNGDGEREVGEGDGDGDGSTA